MLLASAITKKDSLTFVNESDTLARALEILETTNNRCAPILDDTNLLFRGNIYKMHLYRHLAKGGDMSLPVTYLLKNATKFIYQDATPFNILFTLRDLPYIAVLNHKQAFMGVLTHDKLLDLYWNALDLSSGRYLLTIEIDKNQKDLAEISKIITKYSEVSNFLALNSTEQPSMKTVLVTLPTGTDKALLDKITSRLEKKQFEILRIDKI